MADHPNKHIRAAIEYAEDHGWTLRRQERERTFGEDCIVRNETVMDARRRFIRRREMRMIMLRGGRQMPSRTSFPAVHESTSFRGAKGDIVNVR